MDIKRRKYIIKRDNIEIFHNNYEFNFSNNRLKINLLDLYVISLHRIKHL